MSAIPSHSEHARIIAQRIADKLRAPHWTRCPSTHCERSQECRSPHECSGNGAALVKREVYAAIMRERGEGEDVAQMLVHRDKEAEAELINLRAQLAQAREALKYIARPDLGMPHIVFRQEAQLKAQAALAAITPATSTKEKT